jgi:hypothetical protein
MWANMARLVALPAVWVAAAGGADLTFIIWIAIAGEAAGLVVALIVLRVRTKFPVARIFSSLTATSALLAWAGWIAWTHGSNSFSLWPTTTQALGLVVLLAIATWTMQPLRLYFRARKITIL